MLNSLFKSKKNGLEKESAKVTDEIQEENNMLLPKEQMSQLNEIYKSEKTAHDIVIKYIMITSQENLLDCDNLDMLGKYLYQKKYVPNLLSEKQITQLINNKRKYIDYEESNNVQNKQESTDNLTHLIINDLRFFDEENKRLFQGYLQLDGLLLLYKGTSEDDYSINVEKEFSNDDLFFIHEDILDDGTIFLKINGIGYFVLYNQDKEYDYQIILEYYTAINDKIKQTIMCFATEIVEGAYALVANEDIKNMVIGYLRNSPNDIFINYKLAIIFEKILLSYSTKGKYTLSYVLQEDNLDEEEISKSITNSDIQIVNNYKAEYFDMLIKLICAKNEFNSEEHAVFTTWRLLRNVAAIYFSVLWEDGYEAYFGDIDGLTLEQCVKKYCLIDNIDIHSTANIGMFTYYLMQHNKFGDDSDFITCNNSLKILLKKEIDIIKVMNFEKKIMADSDAIEYSINDIDLMGGQEFENFISLMFSKIGYQTEVTKHSGDQGIDIIAEKNGKKIGIQAKCYSSSVGNSAIQEVVAGIKHYHLDKAIVVTNNFFTQSARELAESNNVVLWDRNILKEKIIELF